MNLKSKKNNLCFFAEIAAMIFWLARMRNSDAYYPPYLFPGGMGIFCALLRITGKAKTYGMPKKIDRIAAGILSACFSCAAAAANYPLFETIWDVPSLLLCLTGGFFAGWNLLLVLGSSEDAIRKLLFSGKAASPKSVFFFSASIIALIDGTVLFAAKYPGLLTEDSVSQIEQLMTGVYSNHHPFYHTIIIKGCIGLGLKLFGEINAAVALYSVFQILVMACTFGYVTATLSRMGLSKVLIVLFAAWYALLPCHILYSMTMWKDILFGSAVTCFLVTLFRMLKKIGNRSAAMWVLLVVSGLGSCLLRSNGWMTFAVSALLFCVLFFRKEKQLCLVFLGILLVSFIAKGPVLNALGVSKTDTIESLSIPAQQIARVIDEDKDGLTAEQRALLDKIIDVDHVHTYYAEFISNPIKDLVRATGDQEYLKTHRKEYLKLYLDLGLSHPKQYFEAWVEETKGYWNSGYDYWIAAEYMPENDYGIRSAVRSETLLSLVNRYEHVFRGWKLFQIFESIGFHMWMTAVFLFVSFLRRNKEAFFLFLPVVFYLGTLLIATPVFAEFRYIYAVFCIFPFLAVSPFYEKRVENG